MITERQTELTDKMVELQFFLSIKIKSSTVELFYNVLNKFVKFSASYRRSVIYPIAFIMVAHHMGPYIAIFDNRVYVITKPVITQLYCNYIVFRIQILTFVSFTFEFDECYAFLILTKTLVAKSELSSVNIID